MMQLFIYVVHLWWCLRADDRFNTLQSTKLRLVPTGDASVVIRLAICALLSLDLVAGEMRDLIKRVALRGKWLLV